jgi:D-sedoheptulose 7-phosphate isomerase
MTNFIIKTAIQNHRESLDALVDLENEIISAADLIQRAFSIGNKLLICGNGGSAADSQHFASELSGRYEKERPGLPAISLATDSSALTAIANDYNYQKVFSRQLQALGRPNDVLFAISTSGNSENILNAIQYAKTNQISTIGLTGKSGGKMAKLVDIPIIVNASKTARVQEIHILIIHLICELLESSV